jgi:uncharacterized membrane protein (DUF373 family)
MDRLLRVFERGVLHTAQILLMLVILVAVVELWYLFAIALRERVQTIDSIPMLMLAVQRAFSGVLLIVLGLELLETLRVYFTHHRVRLELVIAVALIAVSRHVIILDFEHVTGASLAGIGALIIALTGGYYLLRRTDAGDAESGSISR